MLHPIQPGNNAVLGHNQINPNMLKHLQERPETKQAKPELQESEMSEQQPHFRQQKKCGCCSDIPLC